ncbi:uncharacterized protein LOC110023567 [Phalaenopsis equestris]|uniref:uncharacterized protein LOC110023567 n=1 Tax=Phalaenopsis equestris TaxID=78828 RepID=UPI0009E5D388|nr:uncharacterized protein LOC110023567 [Phalaenopsis equestris]
MPSTSPPSQKSPLSNTPQTQLISSRPILSRRKLQLQKMKEDTFHHETFNPTHPPIPLHNKNEISLNPRTPNQSAPNNPDLNPNKQSLQIKPKVTSFIHPSSSSSSPLQSSRKHRNQTRKPHPATSTMSLSHRFSAELPQSARLHSLQIRRSKSCGDGRSSSPPDDFDTMPKKPIFDQHQNGIHVLYQDCSNSSSDDADLEPNSSQDETFKCSALCLFLPGIYRKKSAHPTQSEPNNTELESADRASTASKVASFEKFECGSWSSPANLEHDESGPLSYFDLPLELIRCSTNESCSPVKTAFVFDKDLKGVLKKNSVSRLGSRKSCESNNRHVRFSTSSPTSYPASPTLSPCITPRLMKARDEFNALLEATGG